MPRESELVQTFEDEITLKEKPIDYKRILLIQIASISSPASSSLTNAINFDMYKNSVNHFESLCTPLILRDRGVYTEMMEKIRKQKEIREREISVRLNDATKQDDKENELSSSRLWFVRKKFEQLINLMDRHNLLLEEQVTEEI